MQVGTIYRNGQYYGGSSGGATAELDRHEIGYGNDESNIVGSGLFTKKNANIVEDLCEEQQSNSLEFIIDSTKDGDMPAGTITISNGTLETDYDSTQYVKDYEGHGYIGPILYQVTSGQNYGIKFSFETFNKVLADKDYYLSFVGYEDYANLSFHKTVESVTESGATVYNVTCTANTKDAFEGQIVFPPTTGQDLAIYNGNADQDGGKFFLKNKGILNIGGNNLTSLDGNTRFTMHDNAKLDITGGKDRITDGPEIYLHGNLLFATDDLKLTVCDDEEYRPYYKVEYTNKSISWYAVSRDTTTKSETFDEEIGITDEDIKNSLDKIILTTTPTNVKYCWYNGEEWIEQSVEFTKVGRKYNVTFEMLDKDSDYKKSGNYSYVWGEGDYYGKAYNGNWNATYIFTPIAKTMWNPYSYARIKSKVSKVGDVEHPIISMHEAPIFTMEGASLLDMQDTSLFRLTGNSEVELNNDCTLKVYDRSDISLTGESHLNLHGDTGINLTDNSHIRMTGQTNLVLNANSSKIANLNLHATTGEISVNYDNSTNKGTMAVSYSNGNYTYDCGNTHVYINSGDGYNGGNTFNNINIGGVNLEIGGRAADMVDYKKVPTISLKDHVYIDMSDEVQNADEEHKRFGNDPAYLKVSGRAHAFLEDYSIINMQQAANIYAEGFSKIDMQDRAYLFVNGDSYIRMVSKNPYNNSNKYLAPIIHAEPNHFTLGAMGTSFTCQDGDGHNGTSSIELNRYCPWDNQSETGDMGDYNKYSPYFDTFSGNAAERLYPIFESFKNRNPQASMQISNPASSMRLVSNYISMESYQKYLNYIGGYNYYCDPFSIKIQLKSEKLQEYYELTGSTEFSFYSESTIKGEYTTDEAARVLSIIEEAGYEMTDFFNEIVSVNTSDRYYYYYYKSYGRWYSRPQEPVPYTIFNQNYRNHLNYFISKDPIFLQGLNYITTPEGKIYCYDVSDWSTLATAPNYYRKWNEEFLFDTTYDEDGNITSRKITDSIKKEIIDNYNQTLKEISGYTFRIYGDSRAFIGAAQNGKTYVNVSAEDNNSLNVEIHGSSFINTTGHSHIETHDDSTFIMRGCMAKKADGTYRPAWLDGVEGWKRPVPTRENGPGVGYYDKSTFVMRGRWNTEATLTEKTSVFTFYDLEEFPTSVEDFTVEMQEAYNKELAKDKWYYVEGGTVTYVDKGIGEYVVTVTDATVTDRPHNWSEHPSKQEDSPLVEIIEDSILQMYGSSHLRMDDDEIIFGNADGSVSFTIEELNNLKNGSGGGSGGDNPPYELPIASETELGGVKIGEGINMAEDGTISVEIPESSEPYELPAATNTTLGGVKVGKGLSINDNGVLSANAQELTPATEETLGGVKVSESAGLQVNESGELDLKIKIVPCTQEQYDALEVKDPNTLYLIGD